MARKKVNESVVETLRTIPLFQSICEREEMLQALAEKMEEKVVKPGTYLIKEGQMGESMYILREGEVEVSKSTIENTPYTVAAMRGQDNAFFGELALLDKDRRSASIHAVTRCELLKLGRKGFEEFGDQYPDGALQIMRELAKIVCRRFRATNRDVVRLFSALVNEISQREID